MEKNNYILSSNMIGQFDETNSQQSDFVKLSFCKFWNYLIIKMVFNLNETLNVDKTDFFEEMYRMRPTLISAFIITIFGKLIIF